jgi:hypothetical protein
MKYDHGWNSSMICMGGVWSLISKEEILSQLRLGGDGNLIWLLLNV